MSEYAELLLSQYVRPHFQAGSYEVHVIFDNPGSMAETPKELEQKRRDSTAKKNDTNHVCAEITSKAPLQTNWRAFLACRQCKKELTNYLGQEFLSIVAKFLTIHQTFICNIGEVAQSVTHAGENLPCPQLWTNADEADMRVWLHCVHSTGSKKLIFSPDTDVYNIGLAFVDLLQGKEVIVQQTKSLREGSKFLLLHNLFRALENDPDMEGIPSSLRPQALQSLYVSTGCDYVSFFRGMGKVSFMTTFFHYASFIAGGSEAPGTIGNLLDQPHLSFLRLVGATYFRAHASAFTYTSPVTLYHSIVENDSEVKHEKWLEIIRKAIWQRVDSDSKNMPSTSALRLHWTRCMWVLKMWSKSIENDIDMPGIHTF